MNYISLINKIYTDAGMKCPGKVLCLDPGHTTGWCLFEDGILKNWGQVDTVIDRKGNNEGRVDYFALEDLFYNIEPAFVICEDYRVYPHKLERHTGSQVLTIRVIGQIEYLSFASRIPIFFNMASTAKGFVTDEKLKKWGMWQPGMRHSRDAIRHGVYFTLINYPRLVKEGIIKEEK